MVIPHEIELWVEINNVPLGLQQKLVKAGYKTQDALRTLKKQPFNQIVQYFRTVGLNTIEVVQLVDYLP